MKLEPVLMVHLESGGRRIWSSRLSSGTKQDGEQPGLDEVLSQKFTPPPKAQGTSQGRDWKECESLRMMRDPVKSCLLDVTWLLSSGTCWSFDPHKSKSTRSCSITSCCTNWVVRESTREGDMKVGRCVWGARSRKLRVDTVKIHCIHISNCQRINKIYSLKAPKFSR